MHETFRASIIFAIDLAIIKLWSRTQWGFVESGPSSLVECRFVGSSRKDLRKFPEPVKDAIGHALREAQLGLEPLKAKALKGFSGRDVLELVEDHDGNTYRAVYTVRFAAMIMFFIASRRKPRKGLLPRRRRLTSSKSA